MNAINQRLIKLLDPSEHKHPGIPYDFYSGYIIMVANNADTGSTTFLYGSLSYDMVTFLQRTYGLFQMVRKLGVKIRNLKVNFKTGGTWRRVRQ